MSALGGVSLPVALATIGAIFYAFGDADLGRKFLLCGIGIGVIPLLIRGAVALYRG